ncbi:MAG: HAMP domain-containing histidine kinase [Bacteroidales bacterium]|nr:HAMP domain-containing histidine kinase [Bacteroidales bacterium]MCF8388274.1 HAMP domain-containing histidine kinase [Bacteroidales bacterium]MCF8399128.1 HAMP domain-containing histidine kinase [Bacteroidales bacterium]
MRKNTVIFVIILLTVALIGLMVIQVYWIRNAVTVKEANFVRTVNEALSGVVQKLEKMEMSYQLNKRMDRKTDMSILQKIDSVNQNLAEDFSNIKNERDYRSFLKKSMLAQDVLQDILELKKPRPVESRLDEHLLDSLIGIELKQQGINTNYEFGIYRPRFNSMMMQKTGQYPSELLKKGFASTLYPNDLLPDPHYLMIYFPNERSFLISQLWVLLLISVILILMIIFSFVVSINIIFRQKKLSVMKNDFINNMTHEFKTPISTISLACEALSDKDIQKSDEIYNYYINVINQENKRLGGMAEKVLQSAALDQRSLNLKREWINIHEIISDVIGKIDIQIKKRNGNIIRDFHADTSVLYADKMHITNMIFNLVDNANKYSPDTPEIVISTYNLNSSIEIHVKDNGIGISKSEQQKIFDKLYRVPTGNIHNFKGFGLGLSYVKAIVEMHGGKIDLESEPKEGSVFKVVLPIEE